MGMLTDVRRYNNISELIENDEIPEDVIAGALEEISKDIAVDVDDRIKFIRYLEGMVALGKKTVEDNKKLLRRYENTLKNVKSVTAIAMNELNVKEIKGETFNKIKLTESRGAVEIDNEDAIPAEYVDIITTRKPRKTDINKALKDGVEVAGCRLVKSLGIKIA